MGSWLALAGGPRSIVEARAASAYPLEACGLLLGRRRAGGIEVEIATSARNVSAWRRDRYELSPEDWCAAYRVAGRDGLDIVGVWHSHPDGPAVPSRTDAESAWQEYSYLIAAVSDHGVSALRSWRFEGGAPCEQGVREKR